MKNTGESKIGKFYGVNLISVHAAANLCKPEEKYCMSQGACRGSRAISLN